MFSQWVTPQNLEDFDKMMKLELYIKNILSSASGVTDHSDLIELVEFMFVAWGVYLT